MVSLIPILTIGILFGLAMDYQVFLGSAMREEHSKGARPQDAVMDGFRNSARVVTAAWWLPRRLGRLVPNVDIEGTEAA